jgi:hypothetical protein
MMLRHLLAIAVILTVATGCDNVAWGGIEVSVEAPLRDSSAMDREEEAAPIEAAPATPTGPLLLAGMRTAATVSLVPVGMLVDGQLTPLPAPADTAAYRAVTDQLREGSEWVLFASGVRVGAATVTGPASDPAACGPDLALTGMPQLLPAASATERFVALPTAVADARPYDDYAPLDHNYNQRVASLTLGGAAVPRVGATWPAGGMLENRRDIQAFRLRDAEWTSIAVSFVIADGLNTSAAAAGAYSLFLMAEERPTGFQETFVWYRSADEGKAAPRLFQHFDWDGDGADEVLLEVFGEGRRGWVALESADQASWEVSFRSACPHVMEPAGG